MNTRAKKTQTVSAANKVKHYTVAHLVRRHLPLSRPPPRSRLLARYQSPARRTRFYGLRYSNPSTMRTSRTAPSPSASSAAR
jgi:hypothetical protein